MRFLRRSTPATVGGDKPAAEAQGPAATARPDAKGRPTPKRRDAQGKRRGPAPPPPRTQREAARYAKANRPERPNRDQRRRDAAERRERMAAGDERYLLPRDRGPVRAYVRDVVDSRPHLMGMFMPLALVVLLSLVVPIPSIQQYLSLFSLVVLTAMIVEGVFLGVQVTRRARAKFPTEAINGLGTGWYAFTRASQLRRLRIPKPKVARGANP
ncbi:DUF3043 domain-containing protein [Pseudonocardia humida]|uniref:DUF3043 domain-containing protein n=1 Tax=Pseudonocardia humida TaxID=2800819 RepID=A0ABT1A298_9PSEU|nr:DUF3043 domain-containing protein [Pseudonocardia humida]MCO1657112.1 DUF3043 domain-containing protein [Pseudonocardia humida]